MLTALPKVHFDISTFLCRHLKLGESYCCKEASVVVA